VRNLLASVEPEIKDILGILWGTAAWKKKINNGLC